ncbi:nitroreductase family protein [uncultured Gordonia sp.]|uniref:nitroreductase family protein n=1 Tax=uncultured Gordonia sp. TaxID=198437 RepID=UPI002614A685|nr:nitroreductase family protein [uncultured Gordonia sp.]HQV19894.1 nitroreductase family protein [Gordonia sp. (in: high G+C Gram-positive bacteria)]
MHELIESRWSARGYDPTATISADDLTEILEAGRWAATWGKVQPVRFVVGIRGDTTFTAMTELLTRGNKPWAPAASALVMVCTTDDPDDAKAHDYGAVDLGLAVAQMSIQAVALGFNAHPMAGFDAEGARVRFAIPDDKRAMVVLAVGRLADDPSTLSPEVRERDSLPRRRLPLDEISFAGSWGQAFTTGA